jgi:hypothetical protein
MSQTYLNSTVIHALQRGIERAPDDTFPEFGLFKPVLLQRSPIARNRPLFHAIADIFVHYRSTGSFPDPIPYPLIQSDRTIQVFREFVEKNFVVLSSIDVTNYMHWIFLLRKVGKHGIHVLCGLRRTTGSIIYF